VAAQQTFLVDIRPLRTTTFLVKDYTLTKFLVPNMSRSQINGVVAETQSQTFRILTLARALAASYQYDFFH
jgi:hypothetical protein